MKPRLAWVCIEYEGSKKVSKTTRQVDRMSDLIWLAARQGDRVLVRSTMRLYRLMKTSRAESYPNIVRPEKRPEEFILRVSWSRTPDHLVRRDEVMADVGTQPPDPPLTDMEMQRVTHAAKMELLRILQSRKKKKP